MTRRSRARLQRGFSLIEVMIAFTILAVGLLGALAMQTHALSSSNTGKHVGDAMRIGLDRMETLKYQGWATTPVAGWTVPAVVTGPESIAVRAGENPQQFNVSWRVLAVAGLDPNRIRELDVRVTWREPGDNAGMQVRRYAISTFKYNGAGTPP